MPTLGGYQPACLISLKCGNQLRVGSSGSIGDRDVEGEMSYFCGICRVWTCTVLVL